MIQLRVAPIVEGHGEVSAVPELLRRIGSELLGDTYIDVIKPIRRPRSKFLRPDNTSNRMGPNDDEVSRAVQLASAKLTQRRKQSETVRELVLILIDSNSDCAKKLAPAILDSMNRAIGPSLSTSIVLPVIEYETWFVAAAESLMDRLKITVADIPEDPEVDRCGKAWIEKRFRSGNYKETVDQVSLTAKMDIAECRRRSKSFDKLCRELERFSESQ